MELNSVNRFMVTALIVALYMGPAAVEAQQQYNHWFFHDGGSLNFGETPLQFRENGHPFGHTVIHSMADRETGQLLFFFGDGKFYTADFTPMPTANPGPSIKDFYPSNSIIVPNPADARWYYVFYQSNDTANTVFYNVVDMNLNGGKGDLAANGNRSILNTQDLQSRLRLPHAMAATGSCSGIDYWLLLHNWDQPIGEKPHHSFAAYRVGPKGIAPPVISTFEKEFPGSLYQSTMQLSPDGKTLVLAHPFGTLQNHKTSVIERFSFDGNTGVVRERDELPIHNLLSGREEYHGCAFSPDNSKLYVHYYRLWAGTDLTDIGTLVQYDLAAGTRQEILQSRTVVAEYESRFGLNAARYSSMQLGPDGRIYYQSDSRPYAISVIEEPNKTAESCGLVLNRFRDTVDKPMWRILYFPNVIASDITRYNVPHFLVDAGPDTILCTGSALELAARAVNAVRYEWKPALGLSDPTALKPLAAPPESIDYVLTAWTAGGCSVSDTMRLSVVESPDVVISGDTTICPGGEAQLFVDGGAYYEWRPRAGLIRFSSNRPIARPDTTTRYTVTVYKDPLRRCSVERSITVTVADKPEIVTGGDRWLCRGDTVRLMAGGGSRYVWEPAIGLSDPFAADPLAWPDESTVYTVTVANEFGCSDQATVRVLVRDTLALELDAGHYTICAGESIQLAAAGAEEYRWEPAAGLSDPTVAEPLARPDTTTVYTVYASSGNCSASATVRVEVLPAPDIEVIGDTVLCAGANVRLWVRGAEQVEWRGQGLDDPQSTEPLAAPDSSERYLLTAYSNEGCVAYDTVYVHVRPVPVLLSEREEYLVCSGDSVQLRVSGADSYQWIPAAGLSDPTSPAPWAAPDTTTVYTVYAQKEGCSARLDVPVIVNARPVLRVIEAQSICAGQEVQLWASGASVYAWEPALGLDDPTSPTPTARPDRSTVYTVQARDTNACTSTAEVFVEVRPEAVVEVYMDDAVVLPGDLLRLPLWIRVPDHVLPVQDFSLRLHLSYPSRLLALQTAENADFRSVAVSEERETVELITRPLTLDQEQLALAVLEFHVYMTRTPEGPLDLELQELVSGNCVEPLVSGAQVRLDSVCLPYDLAAFQPLVLRLAQGREAGAFSIDVLSSSTADHSARLVDRLGRIVWQTTWRGIPQQAEKQLRIDTRGMAAGLYYLRVNNLGQQRTLPVYLAE